MSWALKLPINNGDYDETLKRKKKKSLVWNIKILVSFCTDKF